MQKRRSFSAEVEGQVTIEVLKEQQTLQELARKQEFYREPGQHVHPREKERAGVGRHGQALRADWHKVYPCLLEETEGRKS
jgi:hypothetical protein